MRELEPRVVRGPVSLDNGAKRETPLSGNGQALTIREGPMFFSDRSDAGRQLARHLLEFADRDDILVLGVPRGGVPVAYEVAEALGAPLDIFVSRKLGVPEQPELAFGAMSAGGKVNLDDEIVRAAKVSPEQIQRVTAETRDELERRERLYREGRGPIVVKGKTVILVDDGVATGSSLYAAVQALVAMKPVSLIVGVPVASRSACARLQRDTDMFVAVHTPRNFYAVGQFYRDFRATSDEEVIELLRRASEIPGAE